MYIPYIFFSINITGKIALLFNMTGFYASSLAKGVDPLLFSFQRLFQKSRGADRQPWLAKMTLDYADIHVFDVFFRTLRKRPKYCD